MVTITATRARANLFGLIEKSVKGHRTFRITSRSGGAVLLSEEDYESLIETLELLSTPGFLRQFRQARKEIQQGRTFSMEQVFGKR